MLKNDIQKVQKYIDGMNAYIEKDELHKVRKYINKAYAYIEYHQEINSLTDDLMRQAEEYAERMFDFYNEHPEFWKYL